MICIDANRNGTLLIDAVKLSESKWFKDQNKKLKSNVYHCSLPAVQKISNCNCRDHSRTNDQNLAPDGANNICTNGLKWRR